MNILLQIYFVFRPLQFHADELKFSKIHVFYIPWFSYGNSVSYGSLQALCISKLCSIFLIKTKEQNRSTEGCSKLKSPETRQVQERLVSTLEHMQVPKWDRTSLCWHATSLQMFHGNLTQLGSAQEFYAAFELTRRLTKLDVICIFF